MELTPLSGKVEQYKNKPTIFINGRPVAPLIYALTDVPGGRWSWEELPQRNIRLFADAGFELFQVDLFLEHYWLADNRFDLSLARKQLRGVLDACTEAAIQIRFHLNAPKWWMRKHPDENTLYADTVPRPDLDWGLNRIIEEDNGAPTRTSLASKLWKQEATDMLIRFCREFSETPEANALVSMQLAGGVYGEWHYWGFFEHEPDTSRPMIVHFREWLHNKYGSDEALQQAWNNPGVTIATATVPDTTMRLSTKDGIFRNPEDERNIIDYYQCQHQLVADNIIHFCRGVKETWPRPIIAGAFYGYFFSCFGRQAAGGHLQLQRVLNSPYVDFLCGPNIYYPDESATGDPYRSRSLIASCRLHNKLWLDEMDQRPRLHEDDNDVANIWRNVMFTHSKGAGLWFYDFGISGFISAAGIKNGWWDRREYMTAIGRLKRLLDTYVDRPYSSDADVLMVFDTDSFYYMAASKALDPISHTLINWMPLAVYRSSAVFDPIHINDLDKVDLAQYKIVMFANTFRLSRAEKTFIRDKVAADGRHLLWVYAPGYTDGQHNRTAFVSDVTGVHLKQLRFTRPPEIIVDNRIADSLTMKAGEKPFEPLFVVEDENAASLGWYTENDAAGIAQKVMDGATSWFFALPPSDVRLIRYVLEQAGVHLYGDVNDIIYAGNGILTLHTKNSGVRTIRLRNGTSVDVTIPDGGATVLLDSETGEILLAE